MEVRMAKIINFHEVVVGNEFMMNGKKYVRIPDERISCCQVMNAAEADNRSVKIQVIPITQVEIND